MLSAYGLKYSVANKENYLKKFWKNRILVLLIPFWITNVLYVLNEPKGNLIDNLLLIIGFYFSFLTIFIVFSICFWAVYKLVKKEKIADIIICTFVFLYSILGKVFGIESGWMVETMGFIYGILIFYMTQKLRKMKNFKYFIIFLISSVIIGIFYIKYKEVYMIGTWILRTILSMNLILLLIIILNNVIIKSKVLDYIGKISYEIYLMHGLSISILEKYLNVNIPSFWWIMLVIILTIIGASIVKAIDSRIIKFIKDK